MSDSLCIRDSSLCISGDWLAFVLAGSAKAGDGLLPALLGEGPGLQGGRCGLMYQALWPEELGLAAWAWLRLLRLSLQSAVQG